MTEIRCTNCHKTYPEEGSPHRCRTCGGLFDFTDLLTYDPERVEVSLPGIWRYRHTFGLPADAPLVSLGEGNTPLEWRSVQGRQVGFKLEYLNPTGSFKDRGSAPLVSFLRERGVAAAVEDSSGNAGASFAAYAAKAGMRATVFVPEYASGPKRAQIEQSGAQVMPIPGPRSKASEAVLEAVGRGQVYASHAYLPFGLPGYATLAYELFQQMGSAPGTAVIPAGQGNLLLATGRGFLALQRAGLIAQAPKLVGVQALACAPLWAVFKYGAEGLMWVTEGETRAEGVRVRHPLRGDALLRLLVEHDGWMVAVDEPEIQHGRDQLARLGFSVEATSAIVWNALQQIQGQVPEPVVAVLTGAGWKSP